MTVKVFFIGNTIAGDDGIGPYLYEKLKDEEELVGFELYEFGVLGFDMLNYVENEDKVIIIDAFHDDNELGKVVILEEEDMTSDISVISQHDFGVEETATILRSFKPDLKKIHIIGITVGSIKEFCNELSPKLKEKVPIIKKEIIKQIKILSKKSK